MRVVVQLGHLVCSACHILVGTQSVQNVAVAVLLVIDIGHRLCGETRIAADPRISERVDVFRHQVGSRGIVGLHLGQGGAGTAHVGEISVAVVIVVIVGKQVIADGSAAVHRVVGAALHIYGVVADLRIVRACIIHIYTVAVGAGADGIDRIVHHLHVAVIDIKSVGVVGASHQRLVVKQIGGVGGVLCIGTVVGIVDVQAVAVGMIGAHGMHSVAHHITVVAVIAVETVEIAVAALAPVRHTVVGEALEIGII